MSSMVLSGDTSGAVTLTVPAVAGTNTITLPAATGTVVVSGNQPAFIVRLTSNQGSTGSLQIIQFDVEIADTNGCYNNTAGTVTLNGVSAPQYSFAPNISGYYQIDCVLPAFDTTNGSGYVLAMYKNGALYNYGGSLPIATGTSTVASTYSQVIYMNGTSDYIQVYGRLIGIAPVFFGGATGAYFSGCLMRNG